MVYRFSDASALVDLLSRGHDDFVLPLPAGEDVTEGEWLLAVFELGETASAAAARGTLKGGGGLFLEPRDLARVREFLLGARDSAGPRTSRNPQGRATPVPPDTWRAPAPPAESLAPVSGSGTHDSGEFAVNLGAGAEVLLVDDDPDIRAIVGVMLESVGLVVSTAGSAEEGITRARAGVDLLVIDWHLPGMNGLELCRALRSDAKTATVPILFLSGNTSARDMVDAFSSGADDYMVKPFRAPELSARVFSLLRRARLSGRGPVRTRR